MCNKEFFFNKNSFLPIDCLLAIPCTLLLENYLTHLSLGLNNHQWHLLSIMLENPFS